MIVLPRFNEVAFEIGPLAVRWYGLTYLVGFLCFYWLGRRRALQAWRGIAVRDVEDMLFWGVFGVILGGRLGYVLFYRPHYYFEHPLEILMPWKGGMASHGGMLGVILVMWLFGRSRGIPFFRVADFVAPLIPLGLMSGRIGNFINGELWGRPADPSLPWAMVFPKAPDALPRHPSQLYQAGLEGLTLFLILWWFSRRPRPEGAVGAAFLVGYGVFRILAEFAREPDDYLGLLGLGLSMGQWLSVPLVVTGAGLLFVFYRRAGATSGREGGAG